MQRAYRVLLAIVLLLAVAAMQTSAAVPEWIRNFDSSQKYPLKLYLVGFGTSAGKDSEASTNAQENARAEVSRVIIVNIKSLLSVFKEEKNDVYTQHLSSITQSTTSIQLQGLQTEQYVDTDPRNPAVYAVAYVSREELSRMYSQRKKDLVTQIRRIIADAEADEKSSRTMNAVTKYLSLYPLYEELKEAETILLVANESSSIKGAFDELNKEVGIQPPSTSEPPLMSRIEVANKVDQLLSQSMGTIEDVARALVIRLSKQVGKLSGQIMITSFTYQDTRMGSPFARYFRAELENQLVQSANWNVASKPQSFEPKSSQITRDLAKEAGAKWVLSGTYWEQGEKIKVMANMRDVDTGKVLAGTEVSFDAKILPGNLSIKPENYGDAIELKREFDKGEVVSSQLQVEVWTDRGNENLLYTEGEEVKFFVRVNREAHVRLLYILADKRWTLLYDDLYIDQSKVNRIVEVPDIFEVAEPFGAEMLVVVARTDRFTPLDTIEQDGYKFVNKKPVSEIRNMRGIKKKKQEALFNVDPSLKSDLDGEKIPDALRQAFENSKNPISQNASVAVEVAGKEWVIADTSSMQTYLIREEEGTLNVYKIQQAEARLFITTMAK